MYTIQINVVDFPKSGKINVSPSFGKKKKNATNLRQEYDKV